MNSFNIKLSYFAAVPFATIALFLSSASGALYQTTSESVPSTTIYDINGKLHAYIGVLLIPNGTYTGSVLNAANLSNADLAGATLTGANLSDVNLSNVDLTDATLTSTNLNGADLTEVVLTGATLTATKFTDTILTGVITGSLLGAPLELPAQWNLIHGYLIGPGANLTNALLATANLAAANLTGVISGNITGTPALPPDWELLNGYLVGPVLI